MVATRSVARFALLISLATSLAFQVVPASATTCRNTVAVTDGGDSATPTPGQLRTAIADVCSGGTIRLRPQLVILLAQGELVIPSGKVVTIISPRQEPATIDAHGASRVLSVENTAQAIISNVIVQGGSASFAGGILNFGSLTLAGVTSVRGNQASSGGGIGNVAVVTMNGSSEVTDNDASTGGGIFNSFQSIFPLPSVGLVTMNDNSRVSDNEADAGGGGGIWNDFAAGFTMTVVLNDSSTVAHNDGGGLAGRGSMILNDFSTVSNNDFGIGNQRGDVVLNDRSSVSANPGGGVSVFGTGVTLNDQSSVTRNGGGGIGALEASVQLNDESSVTRNQGSGVTVLFGSVIMNGASSIRENATAGNGGGIEIESCCAVIMNGTSTIAENQASLGGGIFIGELSPGEPPTISVTLNDATTITGNIATAGQGGGVYSEGGMVTLNDAASIFANIPDNCYPPGTC